MADSEDYIELQKLEEEAENAIKRLKTANNKLKSIQKQCDESKIHICDLKSELEVLDAKEKTLNENIPLKTEKEKIICSDCEQLAKQLGDVLWKRKILAVKLELEMSNRRPHENIMKKSIKPASFTKFGELEKRIQKMEDLKNKLNVLKNEIAMKQELNDKYEKSYLKAQISSQTRTKAILEIKNNIDNVEIQIDQQKEELQKLSNNKAINFD